VREKIRLGNLDAAWDQAERGYRQWSSKDQAWAWRFRVEKAHVLVLRGSTKAAIELLSENLPPALATSDIAVRQMMFLGLAHDFSQQFQQAQIDLAAAEQIAQSYQPDLSGDVAQALGILAFDQKKYDDAAAAFHRALNIALQQNQLFLQANALGSLGNVAMGQEHYDEAIDRFKAALRLSQKLGTQSSIAKAFGNIGWSYKELGDLESALTSYQQAEEASARSGLIGDRLYWLTGISNVYYQQHDYASAQHVLTQALDLARKQDDKSILAEYLNDLSEIALENGDIELAERYYGEVSAVQRTGPDQPAAVASMLVRGRIDERKGTYAEAEESFQHVIREPKASSSQRWEAQARLAHVYSDRAQFAKAEKEFRHSLQTIETARSSVRAEDLRLSFLSTAIAFYDDYVDFLISQHRPDDALQVAELSRARTLAEGLGTEVHPLTLPVPNFRPQQIARSTDSVILFYSLGPKHSYMWVVTANTMRCIPLPPQNVIAPMVKSYRDAVLSGRDVLKTADSDGANLYKILIEPVKNLIPRGSRVVVLPDEILYSLNFETVLVSEPKLHFWIEDVTVSTASSLTLLSGRTRPSSSGAGIVPVGREALQRVPTAALPAKTGQGGVVASGNLLLVGNPAQASPEFPVLRHAETEMALVQHYFPASERRILSGVEATPMAFLASKPEKFTYLHFVTHGTASRTHPLDSAVILSPERNSYKLYARDIVKHPLSAYLVTVSACNGSGTRAYSGEGLVGLSWAFLRAGAHNVIAALWEVSDASTPQLMDQLYQQLSRGQDPASALRMAKLSLLKSDGVFRKPFYWAPFQLYSGS